MSDPRLSAVGPLNPRYGSGCYRRTIRLVRVDAGTVAAAVEDEPHAFALRLSHDGRVVTAIAAEAVRYPLTTCNGAVGALQSVVGAPLSAATLELKRHADPRSNCTHLFDLAALAVAQALRDEDERTYRIEIPDMVDGRTEARLDRGNGRVLTWSLSKGRITAPEPFAGQQVMGGFTRWAVANLQGEELEHALMLSRGVFVATSRIFDMDAGPRGPASEDPMPQGVCWSYSSPRAEHAYRVPGIRRDFSDAPGELLRWFDPHA